MSGWVGPVVSWLAEVYLLSTVILAATWVAARVLRQPARRLVVARSALASLALLVPLTAGARGARSRWHPEDSSARAITPAYVGNFCCPSPSATLASSSPVSVGPSPERARSGLSAVFVAFGVGSGAMVAWLGLGAIASARLAGQVRVAPDRLNVILNRVVGEARRRPRLFICPKVLHPVAVGLIRPSIVLPTRFADVEPEGRIEAALAHEWAHIRNGDLWLMAVSRLLLPLLFAHPLYAGLRRRMRADQEALADAAASAREGRIAYAEALVCWSRTGRARAWDLFAPSLGLWGRSSSLSGRVALLLDGEFRVEPSCPRRWRTGVRATTVALAVVLGWASLSGSAVLPLPPSPGTPHPARGEPHVHRVAPSSLSAPGANSFVADCRCGG